MTKADAIGRAKKIFGKNYWMEKSKVISREEFIARNPKSNPDRWERYFGKYRYSIGRVECGYFRLIEGEGTSWEDAFNDFALKNYKYSKILTSPEVSHA